MIKKKTIFIVTIGLILLNFIFVFGELELPEATSEFYVADYAGVLSQEAKDTIIGTNLNYEKTQEAPQVVIATVSNMQGMDIVGYTVELFEKWNIGNEKYDNGVLVLLSLEDRKVRIEVGYGLEGGITDSKAGDILDSVLPQLSEGNYSEGLLNAFYQIVQEVNNEYGYDDSVILDKFKGYKFTPEANIKANGPLFTFRRILIVLFFIIFLWIDSRFFRGSILRTILWILFLGRGGGRGGGGFGGGGSFGGGGRSGGGGADRGF